ncbi:hypothetical protein NEOKW01_0153 [Nematocida sp. AWRm80]|nr:hypothetical protein NEOKW01_0153 [Nematocida sp. AWRm80]
MRVCIAGLGGIGTQILFTLLEEISITEVYLIDNDTIEYSNINGIYTEEHINQPKVTVIEELIKQKYNCKVYKYHKDINVYQSEYESISNCTMYISALDSYMSRVYFYYNVVTNSKNKDRIYIDCGSERFKSHCIYVDDRSLCIYCLRWLYNNDREHINLCTIRYGKDINIDIKYIITSLLDHITIYGIIYNIYNCIPIDRLYRNITKNTDSIINSLNRISKELEYNVNRVNRVNILSITSKYYLIGNNRYYNTKWYNGNTMVSKRSKEYILHKILSTKYTNKNINTVYEVTSLIQMILNGTKIELDTIKQIDENILPNIPIVAEILSNIVVILLKSKHKYNYVLYSGDKYPVIQMNRLEGDKECIICNCKE